MAENDFVKKLHLISDTELLLDEDRLALVVGGVSEEAAASLRKENDGECCARTVSDRTEHKTRV